MQKVPAILAVRQKQSQKYSERFDPSQKNSRICALLAEKKNSQRLYNNVVDDECSGQEKHTINTFLNTR
jgi:hypothetical protein